MAKRTPKKTPAKAGAKPLREWESKYPEFPNLHDHPAYADLPKIWAGIEAGEDWAIEGMDTALMHDFIRRVRAGESIEADRLRWIANAFWKVLLGAAWEEALRLPGREMGRDWESLHPLDLRDLAIYQDVISRGGKQVTVDIQTVARDHAVSFETARAAYYAWVARGGEIPRIPADVSKIEAEI